MVREAGVEPARPCEHWHLKPASLPIPPLAQVVELRCFSATWLYYHTAARMSTFFCWFFRTMLPPDGSRPSAGSFQAALDKRINYDRISLLNAQMEQIAASGPQRGGRVRAPGRRTAQATPERPGTTGTAHPRYLGCQRGIPHGDHQGGTVEEILSPLSRLPASGTGSGALFSARRSVQR